MKIRLRAAVLLTIICLFWLYLKPIELKAQTFNGVTSQSMGGAGRAAVDPLDVGRMNPAGLVHLRNYALGSQYREQNFSKDTEGFLWSVSVSDGSENAAFPGAFTYEKRFAYTPSGRFEQDHYFVSVAGHLFRNLSAGLTLHHQQTRSQSGESVTRLNGDLGLLWTPLPSLGWGLVYYNLARTSEEALPSASLYRSLGIGSHWIVAHLLRLRLDYLQQLEENPRDRGHLMMGFESVLSQWAVLRAGWFEDGLNELRGWTAGLGFDGPRLKANASVEVPLSGSRETRYGVDMMVQF